jgi:RimJ/RimL family protein N-acetyltransferase
MTAVEPAVHPLWGPHPAIADGKLVLRPFRPGDAWVMRVWDQDPETQRFFDHHPLPPPDEHLRRIWWVIRRWGQEYERGETIPFLVEDAEVGTALGSVELHDVPDDVAEISFMTVPGHRGKGIATAAVRLLAARAFGLFGIRKLILVHDPSNAASGIVARRCGFIETERSSDLVRHRLEVPEI